MYQLHLLSLLVELNELLTKLGKLLLTVNCNADVANKSFSNPADLHEAWQSMYCANKEQRTSSSLEDC